jgi:peptidoglycan/LPS O-acetylase OafA/YrhL
MLDSDFPRVVPSAAHWSLVRPFGSVSGVVVLMTSPGRSTVTEGRLAPVQAFFTPHAATLIFPRLNENQLRDFSKWTFPAELPAFLCGFAIYYILRWLKNYPDHWISNRTTLYGLFVLCGVLLLVTVSFYMSSKIARGTWVNDLFFVPLIVIVARLQPKIIINTPMCSIGRVSFSIYIVDFIFTDFLVKIYLHPQIESVSPILQLAITSFAIFLPAYAMATVTYRFIEEPMIRFGRRVAAS